MKLIIFTIVFTFSSILSVHSQPIYTKPTPQLISKNDAVLCELPTSFLNNDLHDRWAEVIVSEIYLFDIPNIYSYDNSKPIRKLFYGDILQVSVGKPCKGWYFVKQSSSDTTGYIHGNSISFIQKTDSKFKKILPKKVLNDVKTSNNKQKDNKNLMSDKDLPEKCPTGLVCDDADLIYSTILANEIKFDKGKFEKTTEWKARMEYILKDVKLKDGRSLEEDVFFFYNLPVTTSYDADYEKWTFLLQISLFNKSSPCIPIIGGKGSSICLMVDNFYSLKYEKQRLEKVELRMPPKQAKLLDESLRVAFVGKIVFPFFLNDVENLDKKGIWINLKKIQVFDIKTGKIFETEFNDAS